MSLHRRDYLGVHSGIYRRLLEEGRTDWSKPGDIEEMLAYVDTALAVPGAPQSGRLLELGCGCGGLALSLARRGAFAVAGVDIVPLAIEHARQRASQVGAEVDCRVGSVLALPWDESSFDFVVDGHCAHCIIPGDRDTFFAEVRRVLRPGGYFLLMTMVGDPPPSEQPYFDPASRCLVREGIAFRYLGLPGDILGELDRAGLAVRSSSHHRARSVDEDDDLVVVAVRQ